MGQVKNRRPWRKLRLMEYAQKKRASGPARRHIRAATILSTDDNEALTELARLLGMSRSAVLRFLVLKERSFGGARVEYTERAA